MRTSTFRVALSLLAGALIAGCEGGRGSSGFDIRENLLIEEVLATGHCAQTDGIRICPSSPEEGGVSPTPTSTGGSTTATPTPTVRTPRPTRTATPTSTPASEPAIVTNLRNVTQVYCTRTAVDGPCHFEVEFAALRFPPEAVFRVAMRSTDLGAPWTLQEDPDLLFGSEPRDYLARVVVPSAAQSEAQLVVLAYLDGNADAPGDFVSLAESGADLAFVTQAVHVLRVFGVPTPTPTATPIAADDAPVVSYLGIVDASRIPVAASGSDDEGRPIFLHPGSGAALVIEGREGRDGHPVGIEAYRSDGRLPDLQVILSNALGNGSPAVCALGMQDGVPAISPLSFDLTPALIDAVNDLGCRVNDGAGRQLGQIETELACSRRAADAPFAFVDERTDVQFCIPLARAWDFPGGDTIVSARLRDVGGGEGIPAAIVIRKPGS